MSKHCSRSWNGMQRGIELFRIMSDLIPLARFRINSVPWFRILKPQLRGYRLFVRILRG